MVLAICAHKQTFEESKELITHAPVLCYNDLKEELTLQVDKSEKDLGALFMQQGHPISHFSNE
jgi:hypothetical protein